MRDTLPTDAPGGDCLVHGPYSTASCPKCTARQRQGITIPLLVGLAVAATLAIVNYESLLAWLFHLIGGR